MIEYLSLGDYLAIAEMILGVDGEALSKGAGIGLADSALAAPQASFGGVEFYGPPGMDVGRFRDPSPGDVRAGGHVRWVRG